MPIYVKFDSANSGQSTDKQYVTTTTQSIDPISGMPTVTTTAHAIKPNYADKAMGAFIGIVVDEAITVVPELRALRALRAIDKLPKPPTGPGKVPKEERDPKRFFNKEEREQMRAEKNYQCRNGCGTEIDQTNSAGHHIERHADGGQTVPENHAEVCIDCHIELRSGD